MLYLTPRDIAGALFGLGRVLRFKGGGLAFFDATVPGFIKSFWVAALLFPLHLIQIGVEISIVADLYPTVAPLQYGVVEVIAYVIDWVTFPLVILLLAEPLGFNDRVFQFLVPYNWFHLLAGLILIPLNILVLANLLPQDSARLMISLALLMSLVYEGFMAHHGLRVPWVAAVGVVLLDVFISLSVMAFATSIAGTA